MRRPVVFLIPLLFAACSDHDRAPRSAGWDMDAEIPVEAGLLDLAPPDGPPSPDAQGLCGNFFFKVAPEPPNLYFVLDRSGSMLDKSGQGSTQTRYDAVRLAVIDVVRTLGDRAAYGVALFPGVPEGNGCAKGTEVFSTKLGDPLGTGDGPVIKALATAINVEPVGGTPTSATLHLLVDKLTQLRGKTAVVLATDGGPNCNADPCEASQCTYNIENYSFDGHPCDESFNCCDATLVGGGPGWMMCLDSIPTIESVQELRDAGIHTYVVGIPGSAYYATLLDHLAVVGGSARPAPPYYFRIDDMKELSSTLLQIGEKMLLTCTFVIDSTPPNPQLVNVYFDKEALPYDPENGWTWDDETSLTVHGEQCDRLLEGLVGEVQVVAGCPTKQPL